MKRRNKAWVPHKQKESMTEYFNRRFDLPPDLIGSGLTLELRGRNKLLVCGCKEILEYSSERIMIGLTRGEVLICGRRMTMSAFYDGKIGIDGEICAIELENEERT